MKIDCLEEFAERLRELRQDKGLSIRDLAKEVKIGASCISRWERCAADVKGSQLDILADFFGVTTDYLLGRED